MPELPPRFRLPDTLVKWPWPRCLNSHYAEVKAESRAWIESFNAFDENAQAAFNRCDFNLSACLAYPLADKDRARTSCDLMNLFFLFDEMSDVADEHGVREQADAIMDALRNPNKPRPAGESIIGEVTRQFWARAIQTLTPTCQKRFIEAFGPHVDSMVQQAQDRSHDYIRSIESYLLVRRGTIAAKPAFALLEADMDLPDDVINHPVIVDLSMWSTEMLIIGNDIYSYNVEQARGDDGHNIISIVMHEKDTDLGGALRWIQEYHDTLVENFLRVKNKVPSWGEHIDIQVAKYVDGVGNFPRANDQWCFETERYFGRKGLEIQKDRWVELLPKVQRQGP